jgi:excisionase family DNA binding protein
MISTKKGNNINVDIDNLPELLILREVAGLLRVSVLTVKRMCRRGDLKYVRINSRGDKRFKKSDVISFLKQHEETKS